MFDWLSRAGEVVGDAGGSIGSALGAAVNAPRNAWNWLGDISKKIDDSGGIDLQNYDSIGEWADWGKMGGRLADTAQSAGSAMGNGMQDLYAQSQAYGQGGGVDNSGWLQGGAPYQMTANPGANMPQTGPTGMERLGGRLEDMGTMMNMMSPDEQRRRQQQMMGNSQPRRYGQQPVGLMPGVGRLQ